MNYAALSSILLTVSIFCSTPLAAETDHGLPPLSDQAFTDWLTDHTTLLHRALPRANDEMDLYLATPASNAQQDNSLPLVIVLPGALVDKQYYHLLGQLLAHSGLIIAIPNHHHTVPGAPKALLLTDLHIIDDVLTQLHNDNSDPNSELYQRIDLDTLGLVGHSLGGAVGLYAIAERCIGMICDQERGFQRPAALRAAAFYGTNLSGQDYNEDLDTQGIAVALIQGSLDQVAIADEAAQTFTTLETPRALITIEGANHYSLCDDNAPAGARPDTATPQRSQLANVRLIAHWAAAWLQSHFITDPKVSADLWQKSVQQADQDAAVHIITD
jgi:predicted dienelactone hydrolase